MQRLVTAGPRTSGRFASLMETYERNYMLARLIAPDLRSMSGGEYVSRVPGLPPLVLSRVEHERYTTTFNLTYRFSSRRHEGREPDLAIRLYHDARTCEVIGGLLPRGCRASGRHRSHRGEARRTRDLDEGWRLNRFLERWLGYCLRQGHGFGSAHAPRRTSEPLRDRVC